MTRLQIVDRLTPVNYSVGRGGHRVRAIVAHITDGETAAGAVGWFHSPASGVSAHYVVDRDGSTYRVVREQDTAWANGVMNKPNMTNAIVAGWVEDGTNPNSETVSIEAVGKPSQGWTTAQVAVVDLLVRDIADRWGVPISATTVIGHKDIDSVNRARCPSLTPAQWDTLRTPAHMDPDQAYEAWCALHHDTVVWAGEIRGRTHWLGLDPQPLARTLANVMLGYDGAVARDVTGLCLDDFESLTADQLTIWGAT
jgi:N-acetyl-anhydromuramyl-L-alanine amidase AmpD